MDGMQRALLIVLLGRMRDRELISERKYGAALAIIEARAPEKRAIQNPIGGTEEETAHGNP